MRRGHAIGTIAGLSDDDLKKLIAAGDGAPDGRSGPPVADLEGLTSALDRYDLASVEAFLNRHAVVLPPRELIFSVVLPLLRELGERWQAGTLRPSHEHLVSAIVRSVLGGLLRATARPHASPRVIFATLPGERHELGLLCAALLAAAAGFGVIYLGPDLPAGDIAHAADHTGARVVVLERHDSRSGQPPGRAVAGRTEAGSGGLDRRAGGRPSREGCRAERAGARRNRVGRHDAG